MDLLTDRTEAGRLLAVPLQALRLDHPIVLALPRGGVPVAVEVARALKAPLDLLIVRKIGAPFQPELALGAWAEARVPGPAGSRMLAAGPHAEPVLDAVPEPVPAIGSTSVCADVGHAAVRFVDEDACRRHGVSLEAVEQAAQAQAVELQRRIARYRGGQPPVPVNGRTVVVVDDGAATGATLRAALMALAPCAALSIVLALPVAPAETVRELAGCCQHLVCLMQPQPFVAVGAHYRRFPQVSDEEVMALMKAAGQAVTPTRPAADAGPSRTQ